ncbi:MAG TPA: hypothetical protein VFT52_10130 [Luteimonas sp.]|jgi:hypothetical protein|nr:hypothetical protein [Luteimonas sp.]
MRATRASTKLFRRVAATALLLCCVAGAAAQSHRATAQSTWLPVWNNTSGKLEAYLVLEPADESPQVGSRWRFGNNSLEATYGLQAGDSLALLCNGKAGLAGALPSLPHNCMLAALGNGLDDGGSRRATASAAFVRGSGKLGVTAGSGRDTLPTWLVPGAARTQVDVNDLTVFAQKNIRSQGYVSIAGTVAKARLVPASEASPELADRWSSKSVTFGGGYGAFGASIVGHVLDTPGQSAFSGLGLGLTWRTPWSGQLTVGADNVVTRGKNPFSAGSVENEDGAVPYVKYEQDL